MTTKPTEPKESENLITHNMWKIIMLQVLGITPLDILTGKIEGSTSSRDVLKYVFGKEAYKLSEAWDRGDDTAEMATIRSVKNIMDMFKENLRRRL